MTSATPIEGRPEKATAQGDHSLSGNAYAATDQRLSNHQHRVKREARLHLERWLATGIDYHLRLARAKIDALRKGAA
jgi:hypothetical protein